MNKALLATAVATASLAAIPAFAGTVTTDGPDIVIGTKGGLSAKTSDGAYAFTLGGRVQLDYNSYDGVINKTHPGDTGSDLFFRRARIEMKGKAYDWSYLMSYNLTGGGSIEEIHVGYDGWGNLAHLTFGKQLEDFGLEDTGSSKWFTAIEESMPSNAFDTGNSVGVKLHGANDSFTYSLGTYKTDLGSSKDMDTAVTGRVVYRPLNDETGLIHLGAGATHRTGVAAAYSARLGVYGGKDGVNANKASATIDGVKGNRDDYNLEAAAIFGPFHAMAEYFDGQIDADNSPKVKANGYYVQAGWVLTGESRSYSIDTGTLDKVKPAESTGAWEVFARYDNLDLSDNNHAPIDVVANKANSWTLGVNWYVNPMIKAAVNYVDVNTDKPIGGEDSGKAVVARLQAAF